LGSKTDDPLSYYKARDLKFGRQIDDGVYTSVYVINYPQYGVLWIT